MATMSIYDPANYMDTVRMMLECAVESAVSFSKAEQETILWGAHERLQPRITAAAIADSRDIDPAIINNYL